MSSLPIADYALLSDCHSAALVSRAGSIDWLCFPRFDSPALFARLLDADAGHWSIRPTGEVEIRRRYRDGTLVLETVFEAPSGRCVLRDALVVGRNERGHELGAEVPHALLRHLCCEKGEVEIEVEFAPRPEYGLVQPLLLRTDNGVSARGGGASMLLLGAVPWKIEGNVARAGFTLRAGEDVSFALQYASSSEAAPDAWGTAEIEVRLQDTEAAWRSWSEIHQSYQGPWKELVHGSGRVLQALTYQPTGAIIAAPTTSLPEVVGGGRNWDYRFCWVRDASFTLEALWVAACPDEAHHFFDFMTGVARTRVEQEGDMQIVFGVGGEHDLSERELPWLSGWRNSRPVRIGNGAWDQRQLDVYGELLGAAHRLADQLEEVDATTRGFLADAADAAARRWQEPDHGIWEMRGEPRHFLYSKLMCWVALDRAIQLADFLDAHDRVPDWAAERGRIRSAILERGWSEQTGAFTQAFGADVLDASALMIPIVGFLPADDPRVRATIDAVVERLTDRRGLVYRYRSEDGLEGEEGTFLLCTFWLAHALALAGDLDRARDVFERAAASANDLGLLAEEVDAEHGELLGNFPQAFSHIGLVNAAWAIAEAARRAGTDASGSEGSES